MRSKVASRELGQAMFEGPIKKEYRTLGPLMRLNFDDLFKKFN